MSVVSVMENMNRIRIRMKTRDSGQRISLMDRGREMIDTYSPGDVLLRWQSCWTHYLSPAFGYCTSDYSDQQGCWVYNFSLLGNRNLPGYINLLQGTGPVTNVRFAAERREFWPFRYTLLGEDEVVAETPEILVEQLNQWMFQRKGEMRQLMMEQRKQ